MRTMLRPSCAVLFLLTSSLVSIPAAGQQAPGALREAPAQPLGRNSPVPAAVPEVLRLPPAAVAAPAALAALESQVVEPGVPYRNGFARAGETQRVAIAAEPAGWSGAEVGAVLPTAEATDAAGTSAWYGRFVVEGAPAFRVLLRDVSLPKEARIWLHAGGAVLGPYGIELRDDHGNLWLPPAPGPEVVVEIELPAGAAAGKAEFEVGEVMELVADPLDAGFDPQVWTDCDIHSMCIDASTLPAIVMLRAAAARLTFVDGGLSYLCSGSLLNDTDGSGFRPYLLTANHCFSSQSSASSLVAYFDYRPSTCGGSTPSLGSVPSVAGSTLLATNAVSDFTFVELSANPGGTRWYLGWATTDPTSGVGMHRVSHPAGSTQRYSLTSYVGSAGVVCGGLPVSDFHYSDGLAGSTAGGSSGAPVAGLIDDEPYVIGQLYGVCHFSPWDDCSYSTYSTVDGAFSTTFPFVDDWLDPATPCGDGFEPDGSAAQSAVIASGVPQAHSLCPAGDEDWVRFTLTAESGVELETSGTSGDTRMWLYDASLTEVEFDDDDGASLLSFIDRTCGSDPLPAGTYYVKVDEFGDNEVIAGYTLSYLDTGACSGGGCPVDLTLSNAAITGTQTYRASDTITLGPSLTIAGTVAVRAGQRIVIQNGTSIGGTFSAYVGPDACL